MSCPNCLPSIQTKNLHSDAIQQYSHRPISSGHLPTSRLLALPGVIGFQFVNLLQPDQVISFKKLSTPRTPDLLLNNKIQIMYAGQPGYQLATSSQPQMIRGQSWLTTSVGYQMNQQPERVTVCTSVYQNQSYILELQAPNAQFGQVSVAYYNLMVGKFQFL